ncbi:hypothetical protein HK57_00328 [Aspergillus ustus]|uniref:Zn(2)-C6 fungal-type domain-containing protein n=1 Tax=Aspergillus ustus TaxID=40382 RepID=A0A0C1BWF3_ASPUT|nr:hypothetical protein HK57_00328 [Aspergillus ustus]
MAPKAASPAQANRVGRWLRCDRDIFPDSSRSWQPELTCLGVGGGGGSSSSSSTQYEDGPPLSPRFSLGSTASFINGRSPLRPTRSSRKRQKIMPGMGTQKRALRASCDNCHQAKVKCVPTAAGGCQRCVGLGTLCVHSPPGRSGRVPAANKDQQQNIATPPRSSSSHHHPQSDRLSTIDFSGDSVMMEPVDSMISDWFSMSAAAMSPIYSGTQGVLTDLPINHSSSIPSTFSMGSPPPPPAALSDFLAADLPSHSHSHSHSQSQNLSSSSATQHLPSLLATTNPQPTSHLLYTSTPPPKSAPPNTCTCFQTIMRALEKIQAANMRLLSMDVALSQNKESLIHICNTLKCTSPHDSTTRLLMLVLLRKNLNLYHLLYHSRLRSNRRDQRNNSVRGSPGGGNGGGVGSPFSVTESVLGGGRRLSELGGGGGGLLFGSERELEVSATSVRPSDLVVGTAGDGSAGAVPVRLSLGSYTLDHADESSLTKQILLLDVNKVPRLLERLDRRACGLDEADGLDLYNMMRSALIAEFRAIMTEVDT